MADVEVKREENLEKPLTKSLDKTAITASDFEYLRKLVCFYTGIKLEANQAEEITSRLTQNLSKFGASSATELLRKLQNSPHNRFHYSVIESILTCQTGFFRDNYPFEILEKSIFPHYLKDRNRHVNIWCAGCSSGQEPYSIAMLILKQFPLFSQQQRLHIMASDISRQMLWKAIIGRYHQKEVDRGLPEGFLKRYFVAVDNQWLLKEEVRELIYFRQFNLAGNWPVLPTMDIIFLRNVLIYFDKKIRQTILEKVRQVLHPEGYLFLGVAETARMWTDLFEPVQIGNGIYYRPLK